MQIQDRIVPIPKMKTNLPNINDFFVSYLHVYLCIFIACLLSHIFTPVFDFETPTAQARVASFCDKWLVLLDGEFELFCNLVIWDQWGNSMCAVSCSVLGCNGGTHVHSEGAAVSFEVAMHLMSITCNLPFAPLSCGCASFLVRRPGSVPCSTLLHVVWPS